MQAPDHWTCTAENELNLGIIASTLKTTITISAELKEINDVK